jgi:hypothetical protein
VFIIEGMMALQAELEKLKGLWDNWKKQDDEKHDLLEVRKKDLIMRDRVPLISVKSLFKHVGELHHELADAKADIEDKKDLLKLNRDRLEQCQKQVQALDHEKVRNSI